MVVPPQNLKLTHYQQDVQPRGKEEVDEDVPLHQGRGHLSRGAHAALHQKGFAQVSHRRGSARLSGRRPGVSHR